MRSVATSSAAIRTGRGEDQEELEAVVNRYVVLYLATLVVLMALDFLFLGVLAKGLFVAHVGDMLGEVRAAPALCFTWSMWWAF
jgi:hypothetical protein